MKSKILVLCLAGCLFTTQAHSLSRRTSLALRFSAGIAATLLGVGAILVGFLPSPLGDAGHWGPQWCGDEETICIDSCITGCLNVRKLQCEPLSDRCEHNRYCMYSITSYRFANSTSECTDNGCRGGSQCLEKGKPVLPWTLRDPDHHFLGQPWGVAPAILGPISFLVGVGTTIYYGMLIWPSLAAEGAYLMQ